MERKLEDPNPNQTTDHIHDLHPSTCAPIQDLEPLRQTPGLPAELTVEILSRLSVKSLLRFRSVSKSWLALISSPHFIKTHLEKASHDHNYTHHRLLFTFAHHKVKFKQSSLNSLLSAARNGISRASKPANVHHPMEFLSTEPALILGTCNGLVCIVIPDHQVYQVYIWNPALRKFKKLPNYDSKPVQHGPRGNKFLSYGFGYDELSDDYKVVGISSVRCSSFRFYPSDYRFVRVKIYSLRNDSWKTLPDLDVYICSFRGQLVNGKLHWLVSRHRNSDPAYVKKNLEIFALDLSSEAYDMETPPPVKDFRPTCFWTMQDFGGFLSVVCYPIIDHVYIWILKQHGVKESWTQIADICCGPFPGCTVLFLSKEGEILFKNRKGFSLYRPGHASCKLLPVNAMDRFPRSNVYVESLVRPDAFDQVQRQRP